MPAGTITLYEANLDDMSLQALAGATLKLALVGSGYTPDDSTGGDDLWADASANEIANGNGYATGGATLASVAVIAIANGWKIDSDDVEWTASGGSIPAWRYGVLYVAGTLFGKTNPLIGYFVGDTAPADVPATTDGNPLKITAPANGWFAVTQ